ncbi:MAG TPA: zinc ribbon domain-containing protein [Thermoplasmata archaeon]|nr:zinc ribbon domain-containing protein [Thermoplasmata archaeon]
MTFTPVEGEVIIFLLLLAALFLGGLWYLRRRIAERRRVLAGEIADSAARTEERAHNQIVLDEAELATLEREGYDVTRPRAFLADSRSAFGQKDFHHALQIAKTVHDAAVQIRRGAPGAPPPEGGSSPRRLDLDRSESGALIDGPATEAPPATGRPALPKNRMEARFQITLLTEELVGAVKAHPDDAGVVEANRLAAEARALERREEYTDALRIALRARRSLGGKVETLPASSRSASASSIGSMDPATVQPIDADGPSNRPGPGRAGPGPSTGGASAPGNCPRCHGPLKPGDAFCRACGASVGAGRCPRCGNSLEPSDQFCARCGTPVESA